MHAQKPLARRSGYDERTTRASDPDAPTAVQLASEPHTTAFSVLLDEPRGFGVATSDQAVPFQRSASVSCANVGCERRRV